MCYCAPMAAFEHSSWERAAETYVSPLLEVFGTVEDLTHHGCTHAGDDALTCRAPGKGFQGSVITPGAG